MDNKNAVDFIKRQNKNYEILDMMSIGLDIDELDQDDFIKKVKQEVKIIIFGIIVNEDLEGKSTIESIDIVTKKFEETISNILVEEDVIQNMENGIGEEFFNNKILKKQNGGYNVIYLNVLLAFMQEIMNLAKPVLEEKIMNSLQEKVIKLQVLNKIESVKSLNYLEYLLNGYISRLESSRDSLKIADNAITKAKNQY